MKYANRNVESAVDAAGPFMHTEHEWILLALACLDQAGATKSDYAKVTDLLKRLGLLA